MSLRNKTELAVNLLPHTACGYKEKIQHWVEIEEAKT